MRWHRVSAACADLTPASARSISEPQRKSAAWRRDGFAAENQYFFRLRFRPPYDWDAMLNFLAVRATPGVEVVEADSYCRSRYHSRQMEATAILRSSLDEPNHSLVARVQFGNPRSLSLIVERIRAMFDVNADSAAIARGLDTEPGLGRACES